MDSRANVVYAIPGGSWAHQHLLQTLPKTGAHLKTTACLKFCVTYVFVPATLVYTIAGSRLLRIFNAINDHISDPHPGEAPQADYVQVLENCLKDDVIRTAS